jgi:hypothetical protein
VLVLEISRGGICRLKPRGPMLGRLGVVGLATCWSSLDCRAVDSEMDGLGDSRGILSRIAQLLGVGFVAAQLSPLSTGCLFLSWEVLMLGGLFPKWPLNPAVS